MSIYNNMKIKYSIEAEFETVWLINGVFREDAGVTEYPALSPLYVTALPLKPLLLPYTVRLLDGKATSAADLADSFEVAEGRYAVRLKARHNYVYSPVHTLTAEGGKGVVPDFYRAVRSGDTAEARRLMTKELSDSVDDESLIAFFAPYSDIVANRFADLSGGFFLIDRATGKGEPFDFDIVRERINDIKAL